MKRNAFTYCSFKLETCSKLVHFFLKFNSINMITQVHKRISVIYSRCGLVMEFDFKSLFISVSTSNVCSLS